MLLTASKVVAVADVPVGTFFYLKPQGMDPQLAFMAQQVSRQEGDFSGPVVLVIPENGRFQMPRRVTDYQLAVAATLPGVEVVVDTDDLEETSWETRGVQAGRLLLSGEHKLLTVQWGELGSASFINFDTAELHFRQDAGTWLSFSKWSLRAPDGTILITVPAPLVGS